MRFNWFKKKSKGFGWTPMTWQGWLITVIYYSTLVWFFVKISGRSYTLSDALLGFVPICVFLTLLFMGVSIMFGEKNDIS